MIVVKIWGGLGNQLFQYAFGYALAQANNQELFFDIDFYDKQYSYVGKRKFELDKLNCPLKLMPKRKGIIRILESFIVNRIIQRYKPLLRLKIGHVQFLKEKKQTYTPKLFPYQI